MRHLSWSKTQRLLNSYNGIVFPSLLERIIRGVNWLSMGDLLTNLRILHFETGFGFYRAMTFAWVRPYRTGSLHVRSNSAGETY